MKQLKQTTTIMLSLFLLFIVFSINSTAQSDEVFETPVKQAMSFISQGKYSKAIPIFERILPEIEKKHGTDHSGVCDLKQLLAQSYQQLGDYKRAERLYQNVLDTRQKLGQSETHANIMAINDLGALYLETGRFEEAYSNFQTSLAVAERIFEPNHREIANCLNNIAWLHSEQGNFDKALPIYQQAYAMTAQNFGENSLELITDTGNQAELYRQIGDYKKAQLLYLRVLDIIDKHKATTEELYAKRIDVGALYNNMALTFFNVGENDLAFENFNRALSIDEEFYGEDHFKVALDLNQIASFYLSLGNDQSALKYLQRSEAILMQAIQTRVLPENYPPLAETFNGLAVIYQNQGNSKQATSLLQNSLNIYEKSLGKEHPNVAKILLNLAMFYAEQGDFAKAIELVKQSGEISEKQIQSIIDIGSQQQKQLFLNTLFPDTNFNISLHLNHATQNEEAARVALTTILRRKGRGLDAFAGQISRIREHSTPETRNLLDKLAIAQKQLAAFINKGLGNDSGVERLESEIDRLETEISRNSTEFKVLSQPITLENVAAVLPPDSALVELVAYIPLNMKIGSNPTLDKPRYAAYILRSGENTAQFADLGDVIEIDAEVIKLQNVLKNPQSTDSHIVARTLDERIMLPVRKLIGSPRHIFLSPDGNLNLVPFAALVDEQGKYLIENYSLTYLTSGRDLLRLQAPTENQNNPVVLADPLYDLGSEDLSGQNTNQTNQNQSLPNFAQLNYQPLPGTAEEAVQFSRLYPQAQILTKDKATENALKQVISPGILHIATHGYFLPDQRENPFSDSPGRRATIDMLLPLNPTLSAKPIENPLLRSGLILAGVKQMTSGSGDDGVLTALETAGMNLWGTKLVVLSACETGLGDIHYGDGVYGLRRALVIAGSQTQVMSLWKVSDAGTRDLMAAYYKQLQSGNGRTEAMRQAQLAMIRGELTDGEKTADYRHPYYWAAFISSGDWRSINTDESINSSPPNSLNWFVIIFLSVGSLAVLSVLLVLRHIRKR